MSNLKHIERERVKKRFQERLNASTPGSLSEAYYSACMDILDTEPAADVRPVVRGRWIQRETGNEYFCPNCGADMRETVP